MDSEMSVPCKIKLSRRPLSIREWLRGATSFRNVATSNPLFRPVTGGRISTGFQRVGTSRNSRAGTSTLRTALIATKAGMPITSNGRILRLATASLQQHGDKFFEISKVNLQKIAQRKSKSRIIWKYLFYVQKNVVKALDLASYATEFNNYQEPWWKLAAGKCYYHLGLYQQSEKQLRSAIKHKNTIQGYLYLSHIYHKKDSVNLCLKTLEEGIKIHPGQPRLLIEMGRFYDQLQNFEKSSTLYKEVLSKQNCNLQAVANIAAYYYYREQPEIAIKLYQRLLQLGVDSTSIWNNLGLCCFSNHQFDTFYFCFERALLIGTDDPIEFSDIWYNIAWIHISCGDLELATHALKTAITYNPQNSQALNNLAVIEYKKSNISAAIHYSQRAFREDSNFQAAFNLSVWYYQQKQFQQSYKYNQQTLKLHPTHYDSLQIQSLLSNKINTL